MRHIDHFWASPHAQSTVIHRTTSFEHGFPGHAATIVTLLWGETISYQKWIPGETPPPQTPESRRKRRGHLAQPPPLTSRPAFTEWRLPFRASSALLLHILAFDQGNRGRSPLARPSVRRTNPTTKGSPLPTPRWRTTAVLSRVYGPSTQPSTSQTVPYPHRLPIQGGPLGHLCTQRPSQGLSTIPIH